MSARVFIPNNSSAVSVGADIVARGIANEARRRGLDIELVRTGSRGLFWLEPLVEVETAAGRVGYGPVAPGDRLSCSRRISWAAARIPGRSAVSMTSPISQSSSASSLRAAA